MNAFIQNVITAFKGRKTYIVAGLMIVYALLGVAFQQLTMDQAASFIFNALGIAGLRNAIS